MIEPRWKKFFYFTKRTSLFDCFYLFIYLNEDCAYVIMSDLKALTDFVVDQLHQVVCHRHQVHRFVIVDPNDLVLAYWSHEWDSVCLNRNHRVVLAKLACNKIRNKF